MSRVVKKVKGKEPKVEKMDLKVQPKEEENKATKNSADRTRMPKTASKLKKN